MNIFSNKFNFIWDNYTGDGGFNPYNSYSYLNRYPREANEDYVSRKNNTSLDNYFSPLINIYTSPVIATNPELKTNNANLNNIWTNSEVVKTANKSIVNLKLFEQCYYYLEYVDAQTSPTLKSIIPKDIEEITTEGVIITNSIFINYRNWEDMKVKVQNNYSYNTNIKRTLLWKDDNGNYTEEDLGEDKRVTIFDDFIENCIFRGFGELDLSITPYSFQIARTNTDIYNKGALIDEILYNNALSILVIPTDQDIEDISLGSRRALKVPADVKNLPSYIEIDSVNYDILERNIETKKQYLYKMFTNNLLADNIQYTTATASILASRSFKDQLSYLYIIYKTMINMIVKDITDIQNIDTTYSIVFEELNYDIEEIRNQVDSIYND